MYYKASLDSLAKSITAFCFLLFIWVGFKDIELLIQPNNSTHEFILRIAGLLLIMITVWLCFIFSPAGYRLDQDSLVIIRRGKNISVLLSEISSVSAISQSDLSPLVRTFAVGGLFGYYGRYWSSKMGTLYLYTTQRKNRVLIVTTTGIKMIISPDEISLIEDLNGRIQHAG